MTQEAVFLNFGAGPQAVVNCPEDMARLLRAACPQQAAGFATAAYERACCTHNVGRAEFWRSVTSILTETIDAAERETA